MNPDDPLLKILACPLDKGPLHLLVPLVPEEAEALYNPRLRRRYPVVDGVPQLLPSLGEQVTDDEHERLLKHLAERPGEAVAGNAGDGAVAGGGEAPAAGAGRDGGAGSGEGGGSS